METAELGIGKKKMENIVFEYDGFQFFTENNDPKIIIPSPKHYGRRLRRFLRDYAKDQGGSPRSLNYWVTSYR